VGPGNTDQTQQAENLNSWPLGHGAVMSLLALHGGSPSPISSEYRNIKVEVQI